MLFMQKVPATWPEDCPMFLFDQKTLDANFDVAIFRTLSDYHHGNKWVTFNWTNSGRPDKRFKKLTLNCFRFNLTWL